MTHEAGRNLLFVCYSHADAAYRKRFDRFLRGEAIQKRMEVFVDTDIAPGAEWLREILRHLERATAALLLVSQDFMVSPFIQQVELRELLKARIRNGLRLFIVPVESSLVRDTYLEKFQWARPPEKPLSLLSLAEQEQAMVEIFERIATELSAPPNDNVIKKTIEGLDGIPMLELPGTYELQGVVGEGEFARCYLARETPLNRNVVVKVFRNSLLQDSPAFDRHVRSMRRLKHPNVLGVNFAQTERRPHFIVTPHIAGLTLEQVLHGTGSALPSLREIATWMTALADALHHAHLHGCVHGRLRPSEIRFDLPTEPEMKDDFSEWQPMLAGFRTREGLACAKPVPNAAWCGPTGRLTLDDFLYSSPETRQSGRLDALSDQYLLGLVTYEAIAGTKWAGAHSWGSVLEPAVAEAIRHPRPLHELAKGCDRNVSRVVMRALEPDPTKRWRDLEEFGANLKASVARERCVADAKESYKRVAQSPEFYAEVYDRLFAKIDYAKKLFKEDQLEQQRLKLKDAIWLLLSYSEHGAVAGEPTVLSGVARTHMARTSAEFDHFQAAILETVAHLDPEYLDAWKGAIKPGFKYLKEELSKAPGASP